MSDDIEYIDDPTAEVIEPVEEKKEDGEFRYDPTAMLHKTGALQSKIIDGITQLDVSEIISRPSTLESISSFLNGVNNTAVQVTRNNIVGSATDVGAIADAVYDRMRKGGNSNIKTVEETGKQGRIPTDVIIPMEGVQPIEDKMLQRGLIEQTFDEFADEQGLTVQQQID